MIVATCGAVEEPFLDRTTANITVHYKSKQCKTEHFNRCIGGNILKGEYMETLQISWGTIKFKGDPVRVVKELESIGEEVKPQQMVDYAKAHKNSELHKCFTWDNSAAADKYRLYEARQIQRNLIITKLPTPENQERQPKVIRLMMRTETTGGYKSIVNIMRNEDEREKLLIMAKNELHAFERKYSTLADTELKDVLSAISAL